MATEADSATDELPALTKVEHPSSVRDDEPAVILWFGGERALRYVWDDAADEILEETYFDGTVHDSYPVGGERGELADFALETVSEWVNGYADDPAALARDWPHVYELLTFDADEYTAH
jgi:hypothetical protein